MESKGRVIVVEGTIGVGKTTTMQKFEAFAARTNRRKEFGFVWETVDQQLLDDFLSDQRKNAFDFQLHKLLERIRNLSAALYLAERGATVFVDRGLAGDRAFALCHHEAGNISDAQMEEYDKLCKVVGRFVTDRPCSSKCEVTTLLLQAIPKSCISRIWTRDRPGEKAAYDESYVSRIARHTSATVNAFPGNSLFLNTTDMNEDECFIKVAQMLGIKIDDV